MAKTIAREFGVKLAELAGISPNNCIGFTIERDASSATIVTFRMIFDEHQEAELIAELQRFKLVPIDDEGTI